MKHPNFFPDAHGVKNCCFCSSVPNSLTGAQYKELFTLHITPVEAHPRDISKINNKD